MKNLQTSLTFNTLTTSETMFNSYEESPSYNAFENWEDEQFKELEFNQLELLFDFLKDTEDSPLTNKRPSQILVHTQSDDHDMMQDFDKVGHAMMRSSPYNNDYTGSPSEAFDNLKPANTARLVTKEGDVIQFHTNGASNMGEKDLEEILSFFGFYLGTGTFGTPSYANSAVPVFSKLIDYVQDITLATNTRYVVAVIPSASENNLAVYTYSDLGVPALVNLYDYTSTNTSAFASYQTTMSKFTATQIAVPIANLSYGVLGDAVILNSRSSIVDYLSGIMSILIPESVKIRDHNMITPLSGILIGSPFEDYLVNNVKSIQPSFINAFTTASTPQEVGIGPFSTFCIYVTGTATSIVTFTMRRKDGSTITVASTSVIIGANYYTSGIYNIDTITFTTGINAFVMVESPDSRSEALYLTLSPTPIQTTIRLRVTAALTGIVGSSVLSDIPTTIIGHSVDYAQMNQFLRKAGGSLIPEEGKVGVAGLFGDILGGLWNFIKTPVAHGLRALGDFVAPNEKQIKKNKKKKKLGNAAIGDYCNPDKVGSAMMRADPLVTSADEQKGYITLFEENDLIVILGTRNLVVPNGEAFYFYYDDKSSWEVLPNVTVKYPTNSKGGFGILHTSKSGGYKHWCQFVRNQTNDKNNNLDQSYISVHQHHHNDEDKIDKIFEGFKIKEVTDGNKIGYASQRGGVVKVSDITPLETKNATSAPVEHLSSRDSDFDRIAQHFALYLNGNDSDPSHTQAFFRDPDDKVYINLPSFQFFPVITQNKYNNEMEVEKFGLVLSSRKYPKHSYNRFEFETRELNITVHLDTLLETSDNLSGLVVTMFKHNYLKSFKTTDFYVTVGHTADKSYLIRDESWHNALFISLAGCPSGHYVTGSPDYDDNYNFPYRFKPFDEEPLNIKVNSTKDDPKGDICPLVIGLSDPDQEMKGYQNGVLNVLNNSAGQYKYMVFASPMLLLIACGRHPSNMGYKPVYNWLPPTTEHIKAAIMASYGQKYLSMMIFDRDPNIIQLLTRITDLNSYTLSEGRNLLKAMEKASSESYWACGRPTEGKWLLFEKGMLNTDQLMRSVSLTSGGKTFIYLPKDVAGTVSIKNYRESCKDKIQDSPPPSIYLILDTITYSADERVPTNTGYESFTEKLALNAAKAYAFISKEANKKANNLWDNQAKQNAVYPTQGPAARKKKTGYDSLKNARIDEHVPEQTAPEIKIAENKKDNQPVKSYYNRNNPSQQENIPSKNLGSSKPLMRLNHKGFSESHAKGKKLLKDPIMQKLIKEAPPSYIAAPKLPSMIGDNQIVTVTAEDSGLDGELEDSKTNDLLFKLISMAEGDDNQYIKGMLYGINFVGDFPTVPDLPQNLRSKFADEIQPILIILKTIGMDALGNSWFLKNVDVRNYLIEIINHTVVDYPTIKTAPLNVVSTYNEKNPISNIRDYVYPSIYSMYDNDVAKGFELLLYLNGNLPIMSDTNKTCEEFMDGDDQLVKGG